MPRAGRTVTHSETLDLNFRFKVRLDVESEKNFDLIVLHLIIHDTRDGWVSTGTKLWFPQDKAPDMIRAMLRALQAIEARKVAAP